MNVVEMLDAMSRPPAPAPEVVTLDRPVVETILAELEAADPLRAVVTGLRTALAAPRPELWVMFTPGPNETYAFASKEDADQAAADLIAVGQRLKAERIARGESVEFWHEWQAEVVPSPWEPAEHFEEMALEQQEDAKSLRAMAVDSAAEIDALKAADSQLRQQQADVANELDGLRQGFSQQAKLIEEDAETIESLEGRLDASEARNDTLRLDATRYRFLRDGERAGLEYWDNEPSVATDEDVHYGEDLDRVVDNAIEEMLERTQSAPATCEQGEES